MTSKRKSKAKAEVPSDSAPLHRDTRRRFEQWARNPECLANTLSAVHGVPMAVVARSEGLTPRMGQSPFALARGQNFERMLFGSEAERLREELVRKRVLSPGEVEFRDLRLRQNSGPFRDLDAAREATSELFREIARAPAGQWLVASPTILIPGGVMLPEAMLVIDVLAARREKGERARLVVGEIKTYPDRGGYTDPADLAQARAQAGTYVHGLELVVAELGLADELAVAREGFLVLSRPGSNYPSVRAGEDFRYQAERAKRGFALLASAASALPPDPEEARIAGISAAAVKYRQGCLSFCDRAELCHRRALESGEPAVLGDEIGRLLGEISVHRAVRLLGSGRARNAAEADLKRLLEEIRKLEGPC
ncbi:MAG: hypothetical protein BWX64_00448 [Acidobacteria bacterium ADurb.Bin051]|nr:MAG: hypothetical protein BWX64_00448 [Acidobacteria bacterium ADurb.Bin051]